MIGPRDEESIRDSERLAPVLAEIGCHEPVVCSADREPVSG
jgi:hypothetical protein